MLDLGRGRWAASQKPKLIGQNHNFVFNWQCLLSIISGRQTLQLQTKTKTKTTILIRFNLLQFCPSLPPCMFVVLFMPPFNVLTGYFFASLNLVADPSVLNTDTFRDTVVCYTAVFSVVTQRSSPLSYWGGALRDDTKNGCVADLVTQFL